jgi:hypothetical protein
MIDQSSGIASNFNSISTTWQSLCGEAIDFLLSVGRLRHFLFLPDLSHKPRSVEEQSARDTFRKTAVR